MARRKKTINNMFTSSLFVAAAQMENEINILDDNTASEFYCVGDSVIINKTPYCILKIAYEKKEIVLENEEFPLESAKYSFSEFLALIDNPKRIKNYESNDEKVATPIITKKLTDNIVGEEFVINGRTYRIIKDNKENIVAEDLTMFNVLKVAPKQEFVKSEILPFVVISNDDNNENDIPMADHTDTITITCVWSESYAFEEGKTYSVKEFDQIMKSADDEWVKERQKEVDAYGSTDAVFEAYDKGEINCTHLGYAKTKFTINMPDGTKFTERQDIGDGDGGVIDFLSQYSFYDNIVPKLKKLVNNTEYNESKKENILQFPLESDVKKNSEKLNFHYSVDEEYKTKSERIKLNLDAVRLLHTLENEKRFATADEQSVLASYSGWGGLSEVFEEDNSNYTSVIGMLNQKEYNEAMNSVTSAFYTPAPVLRIIFDVLAKAGFNGGKILEPSCGIGKIFGYMPNDMLINSHLYGVEIDNISASISKQLYPKAKIKHCGFEKTDFPDESFDLVMSNVPYGDTAPCDGKYNKLHLSLHDYFICKMIDLARPGGIIVAITSHFTLDKETTTARKYMSEKAELLGAVRLPESAFKISHTKPVTDILFFRKNDNNAEKSVDNVWIYTTKEKIEGVNNTINNYFENHPECILGSKKAVSGPHGPVVTICENDNMNYEIPFSFHYESRLIDDEEYDETTIEVPAELLETPTYSYLVYNGEVYYRENSLMFKAEFKNNKAEARARGLIIVKNILLDVIRAQLNDVTDDELSILQEQLSYEYDSFVHKYGRLSSRANSIAFKKDSKYPLLCSLEIFDENNEFVKKADIFEFRTINAEKTFQAETSSEALTICLSENGKIDFAYMENLLGKNKDEIISDLIKSEEIYKVPFEDAYELRNIYLSGYVKDKLKAAKVALIYDSAYQVNVDALEKVQPKDLVYNEIYANLGSTWIPVKVYEKFMHDVLETPAYMKRDCKIVYACDRYYITDKNVNTVKSNNIYGTKDKNGYELLEDALNMISTKVYKTVGDGEGGEKRVVDSQKTQIVQTKQAELKRKFQDWVWNDFDRRQYLVRKYNDELNNIVEPVYDGSFIKFTRMNNKINLMKHQKDAVARIVLNGNTLLAHVVGAGKTYTMAAAAMTKKKLGLCNKSLFVVPNHLVEQWATEFYRLYPFAKILVTDKSDFSASNRRKFCSKIATGNWDAIIMAHSQFKMISLSEERQIEYLNKELTVIETSISEAQAQNESYAVKRFTVSRLVSTQNQLKKKLDKLLSSNKDKTVTFEELGVDQLFVDEAHLFKNLAVYSKLNVPGLTNANSQKASELKMKRDYLNEITNYKGVVFATGTPISNAICEIYVMQKYLQDKDLEKQHIISFDAWISRFAETETKIEVKPEGTGYRAIERVCRYHNLPELMKLFKLVADIKVADQLNLNVPTIHNHNIAVNPSNIQKQIVEQFARRAEEIRMGNVDRQTDNMLVITNDGRKLAIDERLYNLDLKDSGKSKLNRMIKTVYHIWRLTESYKATQLVFSDLGTPGGNKKRVFNVYEDVKTKLVAFGIPEDEIAFIHEANTDEKKKLLFEKVNNGSVRILLGSTEKLGAGTNVQKRLIAIHNLDCPWRPSDLEQRAGRIVRQGNMFDTVHIYSYVTKNTFDTYLYQTVLNKAEIISQIMSSKIPQRNMEDIDTNCLNYAEIKSLSTGNPAIKEKMELEEKVSKLKILRSNYIAQKYDYESKINIEYPHKIEALNARIFAIKNDIEILENSDGDKKFEMELNGKVFDNKKDAAEMLTFLLKKASISEERLIGEYRGFKMSTKYNMNLDATTVYLRSNNNYSYPVKMGDSGIGNITRINNTLDNFETALVKEQENLSKIEKDLEDAKVAINKPFEQEEEYQTAIHRLKEINNQFADVINSASNAV